MTNDDIRLRRTDYETPGLDVTDVAADPLTQWQRWYDDAVAAGATEPNAMTIATVDLDGRPDARIVLCRGAEDGALVFYTNYESPKSRQFDARPQGAAVFGWLDFHRQVRLRGRVERTDDRDSDEYFATRPRGSQLAAWASDQSAPLEGRDVLDRRVAEVAERFAGTDVPRPPHWGGWRLVVDEAEFWQGRPSRLHDRIRYQLDGTVWHIDRLSP